ncbi:UNVERIFIED_CONTAM: RHS repeat-associated protein [Acetivibrio alkalicellulosi]
MSIKVDTDKIKKLADDINELNKILTNSEKAILRNTNNVVLSTRKKYDEHYVRSLLHRIDTDISHIRSQVNKVNSEFADKSREIKKAALLYEECEKKAGKLFKKMLQNRKNPFVAGLLSMIASIYSKLGIGFKNALNCFAGDPINALTGNFYTVKKDIDIPSTGINIELKRYYNSQDENVGIIGRGWRLNFETSIVKDENNIAVIYPEGNINIFNYNKEKDCYIAPKGVYDNITIDENGLYTLCRHDKTKYIYNKEGNLVVIEDLNSNKLLFLYNNEGKLIGLEGSKNKKISLEYEKELFTKVTDHTGREYIYEYNEDNQLKRVIYPDKSEINYTYEKGNLITITDQNGNTFVKNKYDENNRIVWQEDVSGSELKIVYNDDKRENVFIWTKSGMTRKYGYNEDGLLTQITYDDGTKEVFTYDKNNNQNSKTDRNGNTTYKEYDENGNTIAKISSMPFSYKTTYEYNEFNKPVKITTPRGRQIIYTYDERGNVTAKKEKIESGIVTKVSYQYDEFGRITRVNDAKENTHKFEYDREDLNKPSLYIDPEENEFKYEFDELGRVCCSVTKYGSTAFEYNDINKITSIKDADGNTTIYKYDLIGNLIKVIYPKEYENFGEDAKGFRYTYDGMDRIQKIIDPIGSVFSIKYDLQGNRIKEINPNYYDEETDDGQGIRYEYDLNNQKIKSILPTGQISRTKYDPVGNIVKRIGAKEYDENTDDGPGNQYEYDQLNRLTLIKDAFGNVYKKFIYDEDSRIIKEIDAKGYESGTNDNDRPGILYKYDLSGNLIEKRVPLKLEKGTIYYNISQYRYDENDRLVKEMRSNEYVTKESYPKTKNTIDYKYNGLGRIVEVWDSTGGSVQYQYNCLGNKTKEKIKINEEKNKVTSWEYTSTGKVKSVVHEIDREDLFIENNINNGNEKKIYAKTSFVHDANGNIEKIITPEGYLIEYKYDQLNRMVERQVIISEEEVNVKGEKPIFPLKNIQTRKTSFQYDRAGNLVKETLANGAERIYEYDCMNRRIRVVDEDGSVTRLFYDENSNITKVVSPENYCKDKDDGDGTEYKYDFMNRLLEVKNALGDIVEKNEYNFAGELIKKAYIDSESIEYAYDLAGRITNVATPLAKLEGKKSQEYCYDANGNITGVVDGNGNKTNYILDEWGKIAQINEPNGVQTKYGYDFAGNIVSSIDGNGNETNYDYNSLNRLYCITDALGQKTSYKYDRQGRITFKTDRMERNTYYSYNEDNSITKRWNDSGDLEKYEYYIDGSLAKSITGENVNSYTYTPSRRLESKTVNGHKVLNYSYNKNGQLAKLEQLNNKITQYIYDITGRLERVTDEGENIVQYSYNKDNTISEVLGENGLITKYQYDLDKNIIGINTQSNGKEIFNSTYKYDTNGNQRIKEENGIKTSYTYDEVDRLKMATYKEQEIEKFTYDNAGNRILREFCDERESYSYDKNNRLLNRTINNYKTEYQYDNNGNLIKELSLDKTKNYHYDGFDRLTKVQNSDGTYIENIYDGEGLRNATVENGQYTRFVYSGALLLSELDQNFEAKDRYIRGHSLLQKEDKGGERYQYIFNGHGDVSALTDIKGNILNTYEYDAFGNILTFTENVDNRFKYSGEQYDKISEQYYLRARYYNPVLGRFTQEDTYRGDGLNLYAYVSNNPVKYVDPTGFNKCSIEDGQGRTLSSEFMGPLLPEDSGDTNPIYYFYGDDQAKAARINLKLLERRYDDREIIAIHIENDDVDVFTRNWNEMGDASIVIINVHGNPELILDSRGRGDNLMANLESKNIDAMFLLSCNGGHQDYQNNMASHFFNNNNIGRLVAVDGLHVRRNRGIFRRRVEHSSRANGSWKTWGENIGAESRESLGFVVYTENDITSIGNRFNNINDLIDSAYEVP